MFEAGFDQACWQEVVGKACWQEVVGKTCWQDECGEACWQEAVGDPCWQDADGQARWHAVAAQRFFKIATTEFCIARRRRVGSIPRYRIVSKAIVQSRPLLSKEITHPVDNQGLEAAA